jgi:hypothetical protein
MLDSKSISKFISNFKNLKIVDKFHPADGVFFIEYDNGEIFIEGNWIVVDENDVLRETNYLLNSKEAGIKFMKRVGKFIDNWEIKFIKSIEVGYSFNFPLLKIVFNNNDYFFLKGDLASKSYPSFKFGKKKLYFDWEINDFVLNDCIKN